MKVIGPGIDSWVEQPNDVPFEWIHRGDVRALEPITRNARQRKVIDRRTAAVFPAHNVIDLVGKAGILFSDQAIFASATGTPRDGGAKCRANVTGH